VWASAKSDLCLYYKWSRTGRLMIVFRFVDDMQGAAHHEDAAEFAEAADQLRKEFDIKEIGTASWMLGMRITRDRKARTITLDQSLYIETALQRFGLARCKSVDTPEAVGAANAANDVDTLDEPTDRQRFMEMTGTLMYAAISTRPDIAHAVNYLASNMVAPTSRHMLAAERVLRYLSGTKDIGLVFGSRNRDPTADTRNGLRRLGGCGLGGRSSRSQEHQRLGRDGEWRPDQLVEQEAARGRAVNLRG
jgi:hypothetical protein